MQRKSSTIYFVYFRTIMKKRIYDIIQKIERLKQLLTGGIAQLEQDSNFTLQFVAELRNIDKILKKILYDERYPYYAEIIEGLGNSLSNLQLQASNDKSQILNLCREILQIISSRVLPP